MAPECLKSTAGATEKSDVWSFGIVLWEIFSLGSLNFTNSGIDVSWVVCKCQMSSNNMYGNTFCNMHNVFADMYI